LILESLSLFHHSRNHRGREGVKRIEQSRSILPIRELPQCNHATMQSCNQQTHTLTQHRPLHPRLQPLIGRHDRDGMDAVVSGNAQRSQQSHPIPLPAQIELRARLSPRHVSRMLLIAYSAYPCRVLILPSSRAKLAAAVRAGRTGTPEQLEGSQSSGTR